MVAILGTAGAVVASNNSLRNQVLAFFKPATSNIISHLVKKQRLVITVTERGNLESSKNEDVMNEVEGTTTILTILPEGSRVKKGDLVCELDSATLRDNLTNQEITTKRAIADLEQAKKTLEVAEISVNEYLEGTYLQEIDQINGDIRLAESELVRAKDRLAWSTSMEKKNYVAKSQVFADTLSELRASISKTQAERKMSVLKEYTYKKQLTSLQADVEKAKSDCLAKQATYDLEKTKLEKLGRQIDKCKLYAPNDGLIVYATDGNNFRMNNQAQIEEGATVRERQKIFSLPDITRMQVNAKVHESMIDRVEVNQHVNVKVDAFPNEKLTGLVKTVNPLPDQGNWLASDVKLYTTIVTIEQSFPSLRPGMTAECVILIDTLEDVIVVPVTAVLPLNGKDYVYLINPNGPPERKEVKLGQTNDILIEIKEGVKEGDRVALNPTALVSEAEKNAAFSTASRASTRTQDFGDTKVEKKPGGSESDKGKGDGKAKGKRGGNPMAVFQKIGEKTKTLPADEQAKLKDFSLPMEERMSLMKKAGVTDEELQQMQQAIQERMKNGGGFGGGPGGPGGPGGGPRGGPRGGPSGG